MISTYKPKSIQVIGFDRFDYDFLKNIRRDSIISIPLIHAQEINYVVDANGNLVTGDGFYREYNELNQLIRIRESNLSTGKILEEYTWHPVEERILIKDVYYNNTKNYTVYYVSKEYVVIENQTGNYTEEYIYQDNALVAQVDTNGNKIAVHPDHEGSSTTFTDASGNLLETTFYSAYGEILSGGKTSRFDYEGKEYDSVVQDYDFNFRKYKPNPPIFTQPDTLIPNVYDPQSLNRYSFERNNPYRNTDPTGHITGVEIFVIVLAIVVAAAMTAFFISQSVSHDPWADQYRDRILRENQIDNIQQEASGQKDTFTPQGTININYEKIDVDISNINLNFDPAELVIEDEDEKEEDPFYCPNCVKKYVIENNQIFIVTINAQGEEVSRTSSGGGGPGGGSTVRETEDGRWVCNWCDDQGNEMPIGQD